MKKIFLSGCFLLASYGVFAQSTTYGFYGGVNFTKFAFQETAYQAFTSGLKFSLNLGAFADFKFGNFSFRPALEITGKAGQVTRNNSTISSILYYFEVPADLIYHLKTKGGAIYLGAGPYIGFGIGATDYLNDAEGNTISNSQSFGGGDGEYAKNDGGLNLIGGFQFKSGLLLQASYDYGLTNAFNSQFVDNDGLVLHTRVLAVSVGYAF